MKTTASAINLPFQEAIDFFRQKASVKTTHWTEVMDEAHARSFMVAGAASGALLADFRAAVDKAISEGTGEKAFRAEFDEIVAKHGWSHTGTADWRARTIYQTNMSTAFSAGRYAQQTDPDVLKAFPYWQYQHVNCPNPRLQHLAWSGMVLRADDPWWNTNYPPNGWGCHCIVLSVGERRLASMGKSKPDTAPPLNWMTYIDRTTGVVTKYPAGVDPGFAYNPGLAWKKGQPAVVNTPRVRPESKLAPPVLAPAGEASVRPDVVSMFLKAPSDTGVQIGEAHEPGLPFPKPVVMQPTLVKDAAKADEPVAIDAALVREIAAVAARNEGNPHEKTRNLVVNGLSVVLHWNVDAGFWVVTSIEKPAP
jgi:hypothetical protein